MIIGNFNNGCSKIHPDRDGSSGDVITDCCRKINISCINNFPYGHFNSRAVLHLGQTVTLNAANGTVDIIFDE